jgi:hypothetical protein
LTRERQPQVVERLELEEAGLDLELGVFHQAGEAARRQDGAEDQSQSGRDFRGVVALDPLEREAAVGLPFRVERHPEETAVAHRSLEERGRRIRRSRPLRGVERKKPAVSLAQVDGRAARARNRQRGVRDSCRERLFGFAPEDRERPGELVHPPGRANGGVGHTVSAAATEFILHPHLHAAATAASASSSVG